MSIIDKFLNKKDGEAEESAAAAPAESEQIEELTTELEALKQKLVYAAADQENLRKQKDKEIENAKVRAKSDFARDMLVVADNMERALASLAAESLPGGIADGLKMTQESLAQALAAHSITEIPAAGCKFDPKVHEAIDKREQADAEPGTVVEVAFKGYAMGERVIRAAAVVVAAAPPNS